MTLKERKKKKGACIVIPSKKTLSRLKEEVYINAIRLFCDACKLYKIHSYPSSYAFAILSFEELGKLEMIDHICDDILINSDSDPQEFLKTLFSREMLFSHINKQFWSSFQFKGFTKRTKQIANRELEKNKQDALYVGYADRRIRSPERTGSRGIMSSREIKPSALLPRSRITLPRSTRLTMPVTNSPTRSW